MGAGPRRGRAGTVRRPARVAGRKAGRSAGAAERGRASRRRPWDRGTRPASPAAPRSWRSPSGCSPRSGSARRKRISWDFRGTSIPRYRAAALGVSVARHHLSLTPPGDLRPRLSRSAILINENRCESSARDQEAITFPQVAVRKSPLETRRLCEALLRDCRHELDARSGRIGGRTSRLPEL
jgi:hypothetical protein